MNIEFNFKTEDEEVYTFQSGDIVKDSDDDLYLVVHSGLNKYNLLGLTYNKGGLMYNHGVEKNTLELTNGSLELVEKSENVTIEIKTKGE